MKLQSGTYDSYKKAEGEWAEKIPVEWQEKRVKDLFRLVTETAPKNNAYELLSLYASIGVRPRKDLEARGNKASSTDGYWLVKKNDIVVNKLLAWMGSVGLSNYNGVTSPAYDVLRQIKHNIDPRYFAYLFRTETAKKIFKKNSRGIMDMRLRLYFDKLGAITIPIPPYRTQQIIADYIDTNVTLVDNKITLLIKKINLLRNLRKSLIDKAVIRGLDESVPFVISNTNWLGKLPKHWKVKRLKDLLKSDLKYGANEIAISANSNHPRYIRITDFSENETLKKDTFKSLPPSIAHKYLLREGDILLARSGATAGKTFHFKNYKGDACYAGYLIRARLNNRLINSGFFSYFTKSYAYDNWKNSIVIKATIENISAEKYGHFLFVPLPPLQEQEKIIFLLDKRLNRIESSTSNIMKYINKLRELRVALINDAITGKIKVTNNEDGKE